ncbi:MAG: hypothetical protein ACFB21_15060 [Opitutales bacterium]
MSAVDDRARLGALLGFRQLESRKGVRLEYRKRSCGPEEPLKPAPLKWLRTFEEPDAIVADVWTAFYPLKAAGFTIPERLGFAAALTLPQRVENTPLISGCNRGLDNGHACLVQREQIILGRHSLEQLMVELVIKAEWLEGETLGNRNSNETQNR